MWRINTYTKAIAHMLRFLLLNTCVLECSAAPFEQLSRCLSSCGQSSAGFLLVRDPFFVRDILHFCTKYELICSFNTFCTCILPYYVQKTYKTTYEFHFQLSRDVITEFPRSPPAGGAFIISFGRSPSQRPRFVHFHCLFRTEYELICSFNTFGTCICPYYVQKTYKTTYEFIFSLHSPGES